MALFKVLSSPPGWLRNRAPSLELFSFAALALAGWAAAPIPRYHQLQSDLIDGIILFLAPIGLIAFILFLVRGFARGWVSGLAIVLIGAPVYLAILFGVISLAMANI